MNFAFNVQGIPCTINVTHLRVIPPWRGSPHTCPSDIDYYGDTELEYAVCDQRGRAAPWLERKATAWDRALIEAEILKRASAEELA